jgi:hypothetical protein
MKKSIYYLFAGAMVAGFALVSCSDDDKKSLPKIDGYNNSDEVAADNLVAHWPFDDESDAEVISGTEADESFGSVGFTEGQLDGALDLNKGVLVYPSIPAINTANALNAFTVSLWVNATGNKFTATPGFTSFFNLIPTNATDVWGDVVAAAETAGYTANSDTLQLKSLFNTHPVGEANKMHDNIAVLNTAKGEGAWFMGAKKWSHFVFKWNSATGKFHLFADGEEVGGYTLRGNTVEEALAVGPLIMSVPVLPVFGSLASSDIGFAGAGEQRTWNPWADAAIDDVRIFNTLLTDAEIGALYNLGVAGR